MTRQTMETQERILQRFASLSPKMQQVARFVVDHPNEVVVSSMRTVAERAGIAPHLFVRFAQGLGYPGWPGLKAAVAADLGLQDERYGQRAQRLVTRAAATPLPDEFFAVQQQNLAATGSRCAPLLAAAAALLKRARSVHVAGFRASFPVASALAYGYRLFRNSVHLVDGQGGGLEMQLRAIAARDALVAISFAPYSRESQEAVAAAKRAGARVIALTDSVASPLAREADLALLFSVDSPSFFPSVAAAVALTEALLEILLVEAGASGVAALEDAERQLVETGAYLRRPPKRRLPAAG